VGIDYVLFVEVLLDDEPKRSVIASNAEERNMSSIASKLLRRDTRGLKFQFAFVLFIFLFPKICRPVFHFITMPGGNVNRQAIFEIAIKLNNLL